MRLVMVMVMIMVMIMIIIMVMLKIMIVIIISWVKFWREISKLICHFKCEITRLPWQPSVRLSAKMGTKF